MTLSSIPVTARQARAIWLRAQRLDIPAPFGEGPDAVRLATEHLGYVQIDTINVIERSHHHILHTRIPAYRRADLEQSQSEAKSVFEYWTHALAYVPTADYRMFLPAMNQFRARPHASYADMDAQHYAALLKRIRDDGALSIRDINDEVLVEKTHPWGSRKPSRRALRYGFFSGDLTVSKRTGMLKSYDLSARHFAWPRRPRPATAQQFAHYLLARAVRSQGMVSLDSICFGNAGAKAAVRTLIDAAVKKKQLVPVHIENHAKSQHWVVPAALENSIEPLVTPRTAILSPFDPLIIQRKRLHLFFGYEHRFEAYVPADKRVLGYFALPVLVGDEIVAALDLKMDRPAGRLMVQKWTWFTEPRPDLRIAIDEALGRFELFQKG
ncbi:winged helix-turn-helix domain-containing protein [Sodalis sp. RH22]|uniref:winged helix-turn-helix domain-containing protein n=1 Tax=unclassified Sodalis (in: enterobacteria) TaxID=2636512 RepID=UPI0039B642C4